MNVKITFFKQEVYQDVLHRISFFLQAPDHAVGEENSNRQRNEIRRRFRGRAGGDESHESRNTPHAGKLGCLTDNSQKYR